MEFTFQFNPFVIALVLIGAVRLIRRDWKLAVMLLGGIALHTCGAMGGEALAPLAAACGLPVGKMSGRGLGFTTVSDVLGLPR